MKIIFFSLLLILLNSNLYSQWIPLGITTSESLGGIDVYNSSIFVGSVDSIFVSTNSGTTWTQNKILDIYGSSYIVSLLTGVKAIDASNILGVGIALGGNTELIIKTNNGCINWNTVGAYNSGTWPRCSNDISFASASIGFVVGTNGRILKTTDGGNTWSAQSSTSSTANIKSVQALSTTNVFAAGGGYVFKTINGGSAWGKYTVGTNVELLSIVNTTYGYAASSSTVYRTQTGAFSWNALSTTFSNITAIKAFSSDTVMIAADGKLLISRDGGTFWEAFPQFNGISVNKILFTTGNVGYITGNNGLNYYTNNRGGNTAPISKFTTTSTNYCANVPITFQNQCPSTYTFQWLLNGIFASSAYNFTYTPASGPQMDSVQLIAYNGFYYDTCTKYLNIQGSLGVDSFTITSASDTLCPNTHTVITVMNSQTGTYYKLMRGTTQIGITRTGNGDTLCFTTNNISIVDALFSVVGWRTNLCGSEEKTESLTIHTTGVNLALNVTGDPSIVCSGDSSFIRIDNSQTGVSYQLKHYSTGTPYGSPVWGTGNSIYIPTPQIFYDTRFKIVATHHLGCGGDLGTSPWVYYRNFIVDFNSPEEGVILGDTMHFNNISNADTYLWSFDSSASIHNETSFNSAVTFNSPGEKHIKLEGNVIQGCGDSITKSVFVYNTAANTGGLFCDSIKYLGPAADFSNITALHADEFENLYVSRLEFQHTIGAGCFSEGGKDDNFLFEKYDKNGDLKFSHRFTYNDLNSCLYSYVTGITTDEDQNIYITGNAWCRNFNIAGLSVPILSDHFANQTFVVKFDSTGNGLWVMHTNYSNTSASLPPGPSDIKYYDNKLYLAGRFSEGTSTITMANQIDYTITTQPTNKCFAIMVINKDGIIEKFVAPSDSAAQYLTKDMCSSCVYAFNTNAQFVQYPKIKVINDNSFVFYNQTYASVTDSLFQNYQGFYAFMQSSHFPQTDPIFFEPYMPAVAFDDDNNIYFSISWDYSLYSPASWTEPYGSFNGTEIRFRKGNIVAKYDLSGNLLWYSINPHFMTSSMLFTNQSNLLLFGFYPKFFSIYDQTGNIYGLNGDPIENTYAKKGRGLLASLSTNGNVNFLKEIGYISQASNFPTANNIYYSNMAGVTDICGNAYLLAKTDSMVYLNNDTISPTGNLSFLMRFSENNICAPCSTFVKVPEEIFNTKTPSRVFPNPANNAISVNLKSLGQTQAKIEIYNCLGILVKEQIPIMQNRTEIINIENLSSGVYYLKFSGENTTETYKFVKEE